MSNLKGVSRITQIVRNMSTIGREKIEIVKQILKKIHQGEDFSKLKAEFENVLAQISPFEIVLIEHELVREGVSLNEILKMCDIHLELFRKSLSERELRDVPHGHPLDLLLRENEDILKTAEALGVYTGGLKRAIDNSEDTNIGLLLSNIRELLSILKKNLRNHYRKNQMVLFPYLERRGIVSIPRVMWGREDQVLVKIREVQAEIEKTISGFDKKSLDSIVNTISNMVKEVVDLVFRENKILYPALWVILSEGEWAAVDEVAGRLGYNISVGRREWSPSREPKYPHEVEAGVVEEGLDKLPEEFREVLASGHTTPDDYVIKKEGDIEFETGFLGKEEIEAIFKSLPLEVTYANIDRRVRFFSESSIAGGFPRAKTIIGRRLEYCHPPRLENYVLKNIEYLVKTGEKYRVFWTKLGDRIIRVMIVAVRNSKNELLGVLEVVEDLTDIVNNPEEVKRKIVVL
ncbi:MAG: DUF438 domain-containing protein [Thermosphaera sp.]